MHGRIIYDRFPIKIIIMRQLILLLFLCSAVMNLYIFNPIALITYLSFTGVLMGIIFSSACSRCDYYGSVCDLGTSVLVARVFKRKEDKEKFSCTAKKSIPWLILFTAVPLAAGTANIIAKLNLLNAIALSAYITAAVLFAVTSLKVTCPHCRMLQKCPFAGAIRK